LFGVTNIKSRSTIVVQPELDLEIKIWSVSQEYLAKLY